MTTTTVLAPAVDFNRMVCEYQAGEVQFSEVLAALDKEKRRFMTEAQGTPELEAVFDDTLMAVLQEYKPGNSFIGLLRLRLSGRLVDMFRKEARIKRAEHEHVEQYAQFTRNPLLVKQHEVEFFDYLDRLHPTLRTACQLLTDGYTMNEAAKQLGFADMRTLKSKLQKAFAQFLDS